MKKIFIVLIMLITSLVAKPIDGDINNTNEDVTQNLISEQVTSNEQKNIAEEVEKIDEKQEQENNSVQIQEEKKEPEISSKSITENKTLKNENKGINNNSEKQVQKKQQVTEKTPEPKVEKKQEEQVRQVEPPKTESKAKQEEKIYCVDGGKVHIYGDGANEHGYYKTWDEEFKAYEEYTKGWESTQFKVDQCACGLYYFWVIK